MMLPPLLDPTADDVRARLGVLANEITADVACWLFPPDGAVRGFWGVGPVFFVGDQPSLSDWGPGHPSRTRFYGTLARLGMGDAHLTDVYKRRGVRSALTKRPLPPDFPAHVATFRRELELLKPTRVIAVGALAHELLWGGVPEVRPVFASIAHFAARITTDAFEADVRQALRGLRFP